VSPNEDPSKPLIFIVDDEPDIRRLIEVCLLSRPVSIETFESGVLVSERMESDPKPDLILLDVMMPVMDGYETCRFIREKHPECLVKISFLTARTNERDYMHGFEAGGNFYLEKPFDVEKLADKVLGFLSNAKKG
jgi:DNA-binding response OmpR family regulator